MLKVFAIITVLLLVCTILFILWSACAISSQISRLDEEREYQKRRPTP